MSVEQMVASFKTLMSFSELEQNIIGHGLGLSIVSAPPGDARTALAELFKIFLVPEKGRLKEIIVGSLMMGGGVEQEKVQQAMDRLCNSEQIEGLKNEILGLEKNEQQALALTFSSITSARANKQNPKETLRDEIEDLLERHPGVSRLVDTLEPLIK